MKVFDFEQYSPDWWAVRRGVPTASEFGSIITPKKLQLAAAHQTYIHRLIGDTFSLDYGKAEGPVTEQMRRGTINEPESRRWYEMHRDCEVTQIGFCKTDDDRAGCSPDGLVGDDGVLELKNPSAHTHVAWLLEGGLPDEHKAQVHGQLIVTGRQWADFLSYCPGLPPLLVRVEPDAFTEALRKCLDDFLAKYTEALNKISGMTT